MGTFLPPRLYIILDPKDPQRFLSNLLTYYGMEVLSAKYYKLTPGKVQEIKHLACMDWYYPDTYGNINYFPRGNVLVVVAKPIRQCYSCWYNPFRNCPCKRYIPYCQFKDVGNWLREFEPEYNRFLRYFYPTDANKSHFEKIWNI